MAAISFSALGVTVRVQVEGVPAVTDPLPALAYATFAEHARALSASTPSGSLALLNSGAGRPIPVTPLLLRAVRTAVAAAAATGGLYDPVVPAASLPDGGAPRLDAAGTAAATVVARAVHDWRDVQIDPLRPAVCVPPGYRIELQGLVPALAADAVALPLADTRGFRIEAGAIVRAGGTGRHGRPWLEAVVDPRVSSIMLCSLRLRDAALAVLRPADLPGVPLAGGITTAVVVAGTAAGARVFAEAALRAGPVTGFRLLQTRCLGGLLALDNGDVYVTERMRSMLAA